MAAVTLISNVFIGLILLRWPLSQKILRPKAVLLAFLVALIATTGSLFLSEAALFAPCKLCWLQRIFMYPLVVILGVALYKRSLQGFHPYQKREDVAPYALSLAVIGGAIAAYHYYLQINPRALAPCSDIGFSVSCSEKFFTYYGYITIPWMALSAFALIILLMLTLLKSKT